MRPLDTRIWNLFIAGAALTTVPACGTRALDDGGDTDTSAESGSSGSSSSSQSSTSATTGGECRTDSDCGYGYCLGGACYDWPCGGYGAQATDAAQTFSEADWRLRCQPYYECWDDVDCGDGYVCDDHWCVPDPDPQDPIGPQCDDDAALPSTSIPVPELEQILDLAYGEQTLAIAGTTLGSDISRVVLHDLGTQTNAVIDLPSGFDPRDVALGDLDGDGSDDLAVLDPSAGLLFVRGGAQQTVTTFGVAGLTHVGIADLLTNAGDELFGLSNGEVTLWIDSAPGNLGTLQSLDTLGAANFLDAADADADGRAELLVGRSDGVAMLYDPFDVRSFVLEDSYPQDAGRRRLAAAPDDGSGLPLILDAEAWNDATFLRRHEPILDGFGAIDADWPRPFSGTVGEVALVNLLSEQTLTGAIALGGEVWVRLDIAAEAGCWRLLESSQDGDIQRFGVGDADGDGVQGLAFTDGITVWLAGDR